jgi:hypothetical protein
VTSALHLNSHLDCTRRAPFRQSIVRRTYPRNYKSNDLKNCSINLSRFPR